MNHKIFKNIDLIKNARGLTLIELLVVTFILAALSLGAVNLINNADGQSRYEDTLARLGGIRNAIAGDSRITFEEKRLLNGFVKDTGRLPVHIKELIENTTGMTAFGLQQPVFDPTPDPATGFDNGSGDEGDHLLDNAEERLLKGYQGPYFQISPGTSKYRDGWGNHDSVAAQDAINFGWNVNSTANDFTVRSLGSDGAVGGSGEYREDVPDPSLGPIIKTADWQMPIGGWTVHVNNQSAGVLTNVRASLIIFLADSATGASRWKRITSDLATSVPAGSTADLTFSLASGLIPLSQHLVILVSDPDATAHNADDLPLDLGTGRISKRVTFYPKAILPDIELIVS